MCGFFQYWLERKSDAPQIYILQNCSNRCVDCVWQDVYRPMPPFGDVYLKLTVIDDVLIVSFKEL
jgi:hypothetical protein